MGSQTVAASVYDGRAAAAETDTRTLMIPDPARPHVAASIAAAGAGALGGALLAARNVRAEPRFAGAAPAYVGDLREQFVTGRKFGLTGDGSDQTAGLNAALNACWQIGKRLRLAVGLYGVNPSTSTACVVSNGTSIEGEGNNLTIITPLSGFGPAHSILEITPAANGASEFLDGAPADLRAHQAVGAPSGDRRRHRHVPELACRVTADLRTVDGADLAWSEPVVRVRAITIDGPGMAGERAGERWRREKRADHWMFLLRVRPGPTGAQVASVSGREEVEVSRLVDRERVDCGGVGVLGDQGAVLDDSAPGAT
ncbi:hypothetical protein [Methylobacterium sp. PvR107]|uniref:hypothetical protein n=1 Tax=Methylobacterium sp. PvR107 TaxID=2806597 RepID=UPI001AE61DBC|nr:hypothetical protein [Methylobacterium sp. PvR107]MBP1178490.1 hypothetical protein [Methylobacterium sp. PvR107]